MKYILVLALALIPLVSAVQITEVLYDPINTENGGEAVQIYNPTDKPIDISGYILQTASSEQDATLPNTILGPKQYYLIADQGWNNNKDNQDWPDADYEESITLTNSNGFIKLTNNETLDEVCWGTENCYNKTQPGNSLLRVNNIFIESTPKWKTSTTNGIQLKVHVISNPPVIHQTNIQIDENPETELIEILPEPGKTKFIPLEVNASATEIKAILNNREYNATNNTFNLEMEYFQEPGTYEILITATRYNETTTETITFEYLPLIAIDIDTTNLDFNASNTILGDKQTATTDQPTIANLGNTEINLGIYGTDLTSDNNKIDANNVKYTFDNNFESDLAGTLSKDLTVVPTEFNTNQTQELGLKIEIPPQTPIGEYIGSLSVVGVAK